MGHWLLEAVATGVFGSFIAGPCQEAEVTDAVAAVAD